MERKRTALDASRVSEELRAYVLAELVRDPSYPLAADEALFSAGLIDSFALARLAVFIEERFGVYIPDTDLTVAEMDTLERIVARVVRG